MSERALRFWAHAINQPDFVYKQKLQEKFKTTYYDFFSGNDHMNEFTLDAKKKTEKARTSSRDTFDNKDAVVFDAHVFVRIFKSM